MAVIFVDGTTHYGTDNIAYKWNSFNSGFTIDSVNPRRSGVTNLYCSDSLGFLFRNLPSSMNTLYAGAAFYNPVNATFGLYPLSINYPVCTAQFNSNRSVSVVSYATTLGTSALGVFPANTWFYLEFEFYCATSGGTYNVHINGASVLSGTGNTSNGLAPAYQVGVRNNFGGLRICDVYFDTSRFHGDCLIDTVYPNAAGSHTMFTPTGAAANWDCVDDPGLINNDTTYNTSTVLNNIDTFTHAALPSHANSAIHAVVSTVTMRKNGAGTRMISPVYRIGGVDNLASQINLFDTYQLSQNIQETRPDNGQGWVPGDVNSMEFGYEITT